MAQQAGPGNVPPGYTPLGYPQPHAGGFSPEQQMMLMQAQRAPQTLGLGLGLNPGQRQGWMNAAQQGQGAQWLGEHQNVGRRVQNRVQPGSAQETRLQNFVATGRPQSRLEESMRPARIR
jgi:hypothetical protein